MPERVHKRTASENWKLLIISVLTQISVFSSIVSLLTSNVLTIARDGRSPPPPFFLFMFLMVFSVFNINMIAAIILYIILYSQSDSSVTGI